MLSKENVYASLYVGEELRIRRKIVLLLGITSRAILINRLAIVYCYKIVLHSRSWSFTKHQRCVWVICSSTVKTDCWKRLSPSPLPVATSSKLFLIRNYYNLIIGTRREIFSQYSKLFRRIYLIYLFQLDWAVSGFHFHIL